MIHDKSNEKLNEKLNEILKEIEFPGWDEEKILAYLEEHHFVDRVMEQILILGYRSQKTALWAIFSLLNLLLLFIAGTNPIIVRDFFALQNWLAQFFYLFLGLSFSGGLIGLILTIDTTWFERLIHRY